MIEDTGAQGPRATCALFLLKTCIISSSFGERMPTLLDERFRSHLEALCPREAHIHPTHVLTIFYMQAMIGLFLFLGKRDAIFHASEAFEMWKLTGAQGL